MTTGHYVTSHDDPHSHCQVCPECHDALRAAVLAEVRAAVAAEDADPPAYDGLVWTKDAEHGWDVAMTRIYIRVLDRLGVDQ